MKKRLRPAAVSMALLCAVLAACGTRHAGDAAAPPAPAPHETCPLDPDLTTDEDPGGQAAGPPTDGETGGDPGPPTDGETGYAGPPTDQDTGDPGPPTDPGITNGAGPCGGAGWFDMTRDFTAYYAGHRTPDTGRLPAPAVRLAKVRTAGGAGEAVVTFTTDSVGKGLAEDARAVAGVFAAWRRQVYGDTGTVEVRTPAGEVLATAPW